MYTTVRRGGGGGVQYRETGEGVALPDEGEMYSTVRWGETDVQYCETGAKCTVLRRGVGGWLYSTVRRGRGSTVL